MKMLALLAIFVPLALTACPSNKTFPIYYGDGGNQIQVNYVQPTLNANMKLEFVYLGGTS
jgi:hypothetical protein